MRRLTLTPETWRRRSRPHFFEHSLQIGRPVYRPLHHPWSRVEQDNEGSTDHLEHDHRHEQDKLQIFTRARGSRVSTAKEPGGLQEEVIWILSGNFHSSLRRIDLLSPHPC
jgi:hypothetical protein